VQKFKGAIAIGAGISVSAAIRSMFLKSIGDKAVGTSNKIAAAREPPAGWAHSQIF
jgi:hypothetical protein